MNPDFLERVCEWIDEHVTVWSVKHALRNQAAIYIGAGLLIGWTIAGFIYH